MISSSITYNIVWTIFEPTIIGTMIDPIVGQRASLKALNCKVGVLMCEKGIFNF